MIVAILFIFLTSACSSEFPIDKQKESFQNWKADFKNYSSVMTDYTTKYDLIVKKLSEGTISKSQAYENLKDIDKNFTGLRLLMSDKFKTPQGFSDKNTELFKGAKQSFEYSIGGNHDAVKNLLKFLDSPQTQYLSEIKASQDFAKENYKKALDYQHQIETNLCIKE